MRRVCQIAIIVLGLLGSTQAQLWNGVLAPARAIDWTGAGVIGGIPSATWTQCGSTLPAGSSTATIQAAINACTPGSLPANGKFVKLAAGAFSLAGITLKSGVVLRGSGADQTINTASSDTGCNGAFANLCILGGTQYYGSGSVQPGGANAANWTAGYAQGATSLTLATVGSNGILNGQYIVLSQDSETQITPDLFVCSNTAASPPCSNEGGNTGRTVSGNLQSQAQIVKVTAGCSSLCTGAGPFTVTITPGLYAPNWSGAKHPGAWWTGGNIEYSGVEDFAVLTANSGSLVTISFQGASNCWMRGMKVVRDTQRDTVQINLSPNIEVRDNYFYSGVNATGPQHYGIETSIASRFLIINNIFHYFMTPIQAAVSSGGVVAYNYGNMQNAAPSNYFTAQMWEHNAGTMYDLVEGNVFEGFTADTYHGNALLGTLFRNRFSGAQTNKTQNRSAIALWSYARYHNLVGNVLGTVGTQTIYEQAGGNGGDQIVFNLGGGNNGEAPVVVADPVLPVSTMRWGNWDVVTSTNDAGTNDLTGIRFNTGEDGHTASTYPALANASQTLPASFYYSSRPSWWPSGKPWPAIGPDVSSGNIVNVGGHAYTNPAADCYLNVMGGPVNGTGAALNFNADTCYAAAPGTPVVSLNPTSLVFGTFAIGVTSPGRLITLTNTGTATLNITSISASIEYAQTTTCGATLGAGLACTITVTFTPLGVGLRNGAITIVDNASGSPHTVALSGTGTGTGIQFFGNLTITGNALFTTQVNNVPGMSISPGSLAFGSLALGGIATLPITITSTGNSQLVFTSIILADSVNYSQTNNCTVIVPTASCTINVTFSPQSIAALNTSLTIIANDSGSPHVVTITGTGIAAGGDLPLPTFVPTALSLPQAFVDPMAPFSQTVQATVYIGNTTCPTAPLRTNYKGVSVPATVCDFADANGAGLQSNLNDWCSFSFGGDQRWDVIVTKGASFDFSASPWLWCDKYNGTPTAKYIVFHSDTPNPRGRQVCSHGVQDLLVPPLPDMGQRNHGCTGLLGLPAVSVPMPVTNAAYTSDSSYNDLANMWTITASGPVIQMGAASTLGDPFNDCGIPSGAGACPTDGVNHIVIQDARIMPAPSLTTTVIVAQVKAAEWTNAGGILIAHFLPAAPHDIGFDEDYFTADADDDGFGNNKITDALQMACATCWFAHNYADGIKRDGSEDHVINTANSPGPVLVSHNWMEGGAIAFWGGQAETPLVTGLLNGNTERRRNRMTYNPRWLPSPGGLQSLSKKISGGSCSGGNVLVLNIPNTGAKVITNLVVYLKGVTGVGTITNQWYTAASVTSTAASLTIPCTNGTVSAAGNVFGFATGVNITSAAAMNGKAVKDPTNNNPVSKNRSESKSGVRTLADGEICENSGADGQDGSCYVISSRAYSGSSWGTGGENKEISDWVLTNSIVRNSNNSISIGSRSGSQIIGQFTGVTSIVCAASGNTAAITATGLNGGSGLLDPPNTQTATGTDIYLTDIGNGAISGTPLLANGFYATAYPTGGSYHNDAIVTVTGTGICPASDTTTAGTVYAPTGGNGVGVNTPGHRYVFQNLLIYNIGDHGAWDGGGSVSIAQVGSGLNNWAVNMTVTQVSPVTIVNAAVTAISVCPASQACPKVVQATVGDLAYVQCLNDPRFSSSLPNAKGARMISVAGNQLSFTYTPQNGSPALTLSDTTTCGLQTPDSSADSGYYGFQSFPWPFYWNHITGVGVNSFWLSPGGQGSYIKTATYANSFQLQPGVADIAPANLLTTGGVHCNNSETYSPTDTSGITFCNDRTGLTFQRYVMSTRSIANFPNFLAGVICGSPPCTQDPILNPGTNSTPVRVSTPGSSVTCGGVACDATHFIPDSIGFSGAMVTSNYPLTLPDFRNYSLDPSSPYKAGGILQGMDGKDVGVQMSILLNAQNRTLYVCGLPCGAGPFRDGPRYGFIVWNASTDPSHVNFRIYRNGAVSPTATVTNAYFSDYGLPSGVNSWVVKDWNGTIETSVSGLTSSIY